MSGKVAGCEFRVLLRTRFINRTVAEELIRVLVCCCVLEAGGIGWTLVIW